MASLLLTVGVLSYDQIKKQKAKRALKKEHNSARFSELEAENARRITALQNNTCFCQTSDWRGGNCERHGYVPAAGEPGGPPLARHCEADGDGDVPPPEYEERVTAGAAAVPMREEQYRDTTTTLKNHGSNERQQQPPFGEIGYQYQRGEEDGFLAGIPYSNGVKKDGRREGLPSQEGDVERINGERRRRMKVGGFANWTLKRKEGRGEAVVR